MKKGYQARTVQSNRTLKRKDMTEPTILETNARGNSRSPLESWAPVHMPGSGWNRKGGPCAWFPKLTLSGRLYRPMTGFAPSRNGWPDYRNVEGLLAGEESVFISTQVLVEFWAAATRPEPVNGLGWSTATTAEAIRALRDQFPLLNETPDVLDRWFELVDRFEVAGKHTHDAGRQSRVMVGYSYHVEQPVPSRVRVPHADR
jgi:hypothetical protein